MKKMLWMMLLSITFVACQPEKEVIIDNPTDNSVTIKLDDAEIINLEPRETKTVILKYGKRQISVNDQPAEEIFLEKENNYLLNPTKETYYIEKVKYFASTRDEKKYYQNHYPEESVVEGIEVNGDFTKIENQLLIKKIWKFGLEKDKTSSVAVRTRPSKGHLTVVKIYRKEDIVEKISNSISRQLEEFLETKK